jgi:hypothetical protein
MQFTKDTFYAALRDRLAHLNPSRTITMNGTQRPAVLVAENASASATAVPLDCFVLYWLGASQVQAIGSNQNLWRMECRVVYSTCGSDPAGADRGRALAALTGELAAIAVPRHAPKFNYAIAPAVALGTNIFWSDPRFADTSSTGSALTRSVDFTVFFFSEVTA